MTILSDIKDGIERARRGGLSLYWQRDMEREYRSIKPTAAEKRAYTELKNVLQAVPQWSDEAELNEEMEKQGGQVMFCYFFKEHNSMVQLTKDCNGSFDVSYVLDAEISPAERKTAAQQVQKLLANQMQRWGMPFMKSTIPEKMKYNYLEEAASHLLQVLNDPESITG